MAKVEIEDTELSELRKKAGAADKYQAQAEALTGKLTTAEAAAARVAELEGQVKGFKDREIESTFKAAGITDPKVRRFFELEHNDLAPAADGSKPDIGTWLGELQKKPVAERPAHLAPFLGGQTQTPTQPRTGTLPDPNKGARGVESAKPTFTAEQVKAMNPAEFRQNFAAIQAQFPELANMKLPGAGSATTN